jgi:hypothetical protein
MDDRTGLANTPLADAIGRVGESGDGLSIDVTATADNKPAVSVEGSKTIGKGWSVAGAAWLAKGWTVVGKLRWKPGGKQ